MTHIAWYGRSGHAVAAAILIGAIGMLGGKTAEAEPVKDGAELEALSATPHITGLGAYLAALEGFSSPHALCSVPTGDITYGSSHGVELDYIESVFVHERLPQHLGWRRTAFSGDLDR